MQELISLFGLKPPETEVFLKLFEKKDSTVKDLMKLTEISQAKIYNILKILEEKELITSSLADSGKTRIYNVNNPQKLTTIQATHLKELKEKSEKLTNLLQEKYDNLHSEGVCLVKPTHFLITEKDLAVSKIKEYLTQAEKEIICIGLPLWLIDRIFEFLSTAFLERECYVEIYIPDFEIIPKQFLKIKHFSPKIIKIPHYQFIEVNGTPYFQCEIVVDRKYMLGISYSASYDVILNSFTGYNCITNCILPNLYQNLVVSEQTTPRMVPKESRVLEILKKEEKPLSKKELCSHTGLSGQILNQTLNRLLESNKIRIILSKYRKGRPRTEVQLIA